MFLYLFYVEIESMYCYNNSVLIVVRIVLLTLYANCWRSLILLMTHRDLFCMKKIYGLVRKFFCHVFCFFLL